MIDLSVIYSAGVAHPVEMIKSKLQLQYTLEAAATYAATKSSTSSPSPSSSSPSSPSSSSSFKRQRIPSTIPSPGAHLSGPSLTIPHPQSILSPAGFQSSTLAIPTTSTTSPAQIRFSSTATVEPSSSSEFLSTTRDKFKNPYDVVRQTVGAQGLGGMWRGFGATLIFRSSFAVS